ncbi:MAG: hypothetical protein WDZ89_01555 [Gemmatimonadota bacterium]
MRGRNFFGALLGAFLLAACGGGEAIVLAELEDTNIEGEVEQRTLRNLEVRLIPYDRDAIFDSLEALAPRPEPQIPDSILELRSRMAEAEQEWRQSEQEWSELRENLQQISAQMEDLHPGEARYAVLFRDFQAQEGRLDRLERQKDAAFAEFTSLQSQSFEQAEEIRLMREQWADEAFADFDVAVQERLSASGRQMQVDTTGNNGVVRFNAQPGQWWVYSRFDLPFNELYWNVPITLERGEQVELRLNRDNAEVRPRL